MGGWTEGPYFIGPETGVPKISDTENAKEYYQ